MRDCDILGGPLEEVTFKCTMSDDQGQEVCRRPHRGPGYMEEGSRPHGFSSHGLMCGSAGGQFLGHDKGWGPQPFTPGPSASAVSSQDHPDASEWCPLSAVSSAVGRGGSSV